MTRREQDGTDALAGYSGKPLVEKLGIKPESTVALVGGPANYRKMLAPLPRSVRFGTIADKPQLIHYFCTARDRLAKDLPPLRRKMRDDASLWISWPKKAAAGRRP